MLRKRYNLSSWRRMMAVGILTIAATSAARAQDAVQAQMWAATARYVYNDDPNIKPSVAKLKAELGQPKTLGEFEQKLMAAGEEIAQASKTPNVRVLQRQFKNMRTLNAAELATNLPDSLGKMPARSTGERRERLDDLKSELMRLAQSTGSTPAGTPQTAAAPAATAEPVATTTEPVTQLSPPIAPATSPLLWAALAMSGLSLLGVIRLLTRSRSHHSSSSSESSGRSSHSRPSSAELSPEQHREVESMIAKAMGNRASTPAPKPAPTPTPPPLQSTKQKLTNAAKTTRPPAEAPTELPSLASIAGEAPKPVPTPSVAAPPVATVAAATAVEPGTSIDLALAPSAAPAPRQRLQFVNEAPFNNTFAARTLSDTLAPYSIYEIIANEQTPDQGQFRVVGNLVSHISNHRNILEPVCEYVAYPQGGETRIVTEQAGEVRRRGEDWEIVRRARIKFE